FGGGGWVTTDFGAGLNSADAVAVQPDGRVVVAGKQNDGTWDNVALARYLPDGSPDLSFGTGGRGTPQVGRDVRAAWGVAVQPDGKVVAAGSANGDQGELLALLRYLPDGSPDGAFGAGGQVLASG